MARRKKSAEQKAAEALAKMMGIKAPSTEEAIQQSREQEAIIAYVEKPELFSKVKCRRCSTIFAVDRANIGFCSDPCRTKTLKDLGITRAPENSPNGVNDKNYVWRVYWGNEPLIVPGEVIQQIESRSEQLVVPTTEIIDTTPDLISGVIDKPIGTGFDDLDAILYGT